MKYFAVLAVLATILLGYLTVFMIATVKHDPDVWHVDPLTEPACATPNCFRMAPEGSTSEPIDAIGPIYGKRALDMAQAFHEYVLTQRATQHVAGITAGLHMTYVQRSERLQLPDYISVKFLDLPDDRSTVAIFSRSRFGYGDLGVNEARVRQWIKGMESVELEPPRYAEDGDG